MQNAHSRIDISIIWFFETVVNSYKYSYRLLSIIQICNELNKQT